MGKSQKSSKDNAKESSGNFAEVWNNPGMRWMAIAAGICVILCIALGVTTIILALRGPRIVYETIEVEKPPVVEDVQGHTLAEFTTVIVGETQKREKLIVAETEVSASTILTDNGLFNWEIFEKNQTATYYGDAQYIVDFSKLKDSDMVYNDVTNTLTVVFPGSELNDVFFLPERTVFSDIERGSFLAFGDLKFSPEQTRDIESSALELLRKVASNEKYLDRANEYAEIALKEFVRDIVYEIDPSVRVDVRVGSGSKK